MFKSIKILFCTCVCTLVLDSLTVGHEVYVHAAVDPLKVHQYVQHIRLKIFPEEKM